MQFDPENKIVKLCAEGMQMEGEGKMHEAATLFRDAWNKAENDFEKFTAAHYVARHQSNVADKLKWDQTALEHALRIEDEMIKGTYPSLYLNVAKCYEDLGDNENARTNYEKALTYCDILPLDGYGKMIRSGVNAGLSRMDDLSG